MDMLEGQQIFAKDGQMHNVSRYLEATKIIIYFFSASWVNVTELLESLKILYEENLKRSTGMEIIYVSADSEERLFKKHFFEEHGPWVAIPFKSIVAEELRWRYDITCLPQLIVVKKEDGFIITRKGKGELEKLGINVIVTWTDFVQ